MQVTDERLAAYASGELDDDERDTVEAALATSPALRARLTAIRHVDAQLAALPSVAPTDGFDDRLEAVLAPELERQLGHARPDAGLPVPDELATRRRRASDWLPRIAGAAAGLALLGVVGIGVSSQLTGGGDEGGFGDAGGDGAQVETLEQEGSASGEAGSDADADGPRVLATGRTYDDEALAALAGDESLAEVSSRRLGATEGRDVAATYAGALGLGESRAAELSGREETAADDAGPEDGGATGDQRLESGEQAEPMPYGASGVSDSQRADVRRCLRALTDGADPPAIPVYAELARYEGQGVVVFGIVTLDDAGEAFTRREIRVLDRADCEVRYRTAGR